MKHNMITSASGWRKIFTSSADETDISSDIGQENTVIAALAADTFADYIISKNESPMIVLGIDSRPTGPVIAEIMLRVFLSKKIAIAYTGIIASPEIMSFSRYFNGFAYISASHNPVGHNGLKFGLNDGGVLNAEENAILVKEFEKKCAREDAASYAQKLIHSCSDVDLDWLFAESVAAKHTALNSYRMFSKIVISGTSNLQKQNSFFARIRKTILNHPLSVVCDMNGSARTLSIDSTFLNECGITLHTINNRPGIIAHEIIPEPENLVYCAAEMERLQKEGDKTCVLGYMPDCDGDRGNLVYWDEKLQKAEVLKAQEVFALSVLAEVAYSIYQEQNISGKGLACKAQQILNSKAQNHNSFEKIADDLKLSVAVNGPTSMRIDEIVNSFGGKVFRSEVGEANVVNLAREKRAEGYTVRILGEGSNGGNITHPSCVRDPLSTLFALIKLLVLRDEVIDGVEQKGLFHLWCIASGQTEKYKENYTLRDIISTLPQCTTTGVSEKRAILNIKTSDHAILKSRFQKIFEQQWNVHKEELKKLYGFYSWQAVITNGTKEEKDVTDFSKSGRGGLKIIFKDENENPLAFIWMRGSGTESVFRVMCDVKGNKPNEEKRLLEWETQMILKADSL